MTGMVGKRSGDMRLSIHATWRQLAMAGMTDDDEATTSRRRQRLLISGQNLGEVQPHGATVGQVVGENLRRIRERHHLTQHEAARRCVAAGLPWTRVRVAAMERGARESVDLGTLRLLADAFGVELADFFAGDGDVVLSPKAQQSRAGLRAALTGKTPGASIAARDVVVVTVDDLEGAKASREWRRWHQRSIPVEADEALADRLGVPLDDALRAAEALWGRSLTEERDARVVALGEMEPGERQAHRGHITRELAREVEARIGEAAS